MKGTIALLAMLVALTPVFGQDVPLSVDGGTKIKIDKVITIQADAILVSKFPTNVTAPANGFNYTWTYPDGVQAKKKANVLTILNAPKGEMTISLEMTTIDFDKKVVKTLYGETTFIIGDVPPGPNPPPPPPGPVDPVPPADFVASLKTAFTKDGGATAGNLAIAKQIATATRAAAANSSSLAFKTEGDFFDPWNKAVKALTPNGELLQTRIAIGTYLQGIFGKDLTTPLTDATRQQLNTEYLKVAVALESLTKTKSK